MKRWALWIVASLLALEFILAGASKFGAASGWTQMFVHWGYPAWFRLVVGALEVAGGAALLVPVTRRPAAGLLLIMMVGAVMTHLLHEEARRLIVPVVVGAGLLWVILARK